MSTPPEGSPDPYPSRNGAWEMGNDPVVDRIAARRLMQYPNDLIHEYQPGDPSILTGNDENFARPVLHTPEWRSPSLSQLARATHDPGSQYPHATDNERIAYSNSASQFADARVRQDFSRIAFGSLDQQAARHDPGDPVGQRRSDTSIDAAFGVMNTASEYLRQQQAMAAIESQRAAEERERQLRAYKGEKRDRRASGSPSDDQRPAKHHSSTSRRRSRGRG